MRRKDLKSRMMKLIGDSVDPKKVDVEKLVDSILDETAQELLHYKADYDPAAQVLMERLANMRYKVTRAGIYPDSGDPSSKYRDPRVFPEGQQTQHEEWIFKRYYGILSGWATVAADRIKENIPPSGSNKHPGADCDPGKHGSALQNISSSIAALSMTRSQHIYQVMKVKLHVMELEGAAETAALLWNWADGQGDTIPKSDVKKAIEGVLEPHYKKVFNDNRFERFFAYWKYKVKQILSKEDLHW